MEDEQSESQSSEKAKFCNKAILSFLLAILGPFTILGIFYPDVVVRNLSVFAPAIMALLALDFGIVALKKIKASHGTLKGKGFAISGIVIAPIVLAMLIIIFISVLGRVKDIGWRMTCQRHMNEIGKAMLVYVNNFDKYPTPEKWCDLLIQECNVPRDYFSCPLADKETSNYAINQYITEMKPTNDTDIVVFFEAQSGWNQVGGPEILTTENHQGDGCNVVFLDGHVEFIYTRKLNKLKWKPED